MYKKIFAKILMMTIMVFGPTTFIACGGNDENSEYKGGISDGTNSVLFINSTNYAQLPYAWFMNWGDGYGSFMIDNQNAILKGIDQSSGYSYVAVRIPYTSGAIPTGTFTSIADLDFDINRITSTQKCDMTGWSLNLTMTIAKQGDKYIIDIISDNLHIFESDDETGNGQKGSLMIHYEGLLKIYGSN